MTEHLVNFTNALICRDGHIEHGDLVVSIASGLIVDNRNIGTIIEEIDLKGQILAPGFIEVQTNGLLGFHFTHFDSPSDYADKLDHVSRHLPSDGVTGFYPTIPTVSTADFQNILPCLTPRPVSGGATILGAHCEGPYLHPSKKGAHDESLFKLPNVNPLDVYGPSASSCETIKIVTLAPELEDSTKLIEDLTGKGIKVSLGHSTATFDQGVAGVQAGATLLTHTLNAMPPMHHRDPGLAGLISSPAGTLPCTPFYSIIPDGNHLHPAVVSFLFRANPRKCILTTDSIELSGLADGTYPGHSQIPHNQTKIGSRVVIEGTDTLIGGCASLQECVQNVIRWSGCTIAEAVRCVTENVVAFTSDTTRGILEPGRRADFVILDDHAAVLQTYVGGICVYQKT